MCKFESSQKDESKWQSTDSSKAYRNTSAFKCVLLISLVWTYPLYAESQLMVLDPCPELALDL